MNRAPLADDDDADDADDGIGIAADGVVGGGRTTGAITDDGVIDVTPLFDIDDVDIVTDDVDDDDTVDDGDGDGDDDARLNDMERGSAK